MEKRNTIGCSCIKSAEKNLFFLHWSMRFFQISVQSSILQINVSQSVNESYKVCFPFILSLSTLHQKVAKVLWRVDHPGSQALVQSVGKHQGWGTQCHLLTSVVLFFSCKEGKDVPCTAFPPFTVKPLVSTHQGC